MHIYSEQGAWGQISETSVPVAPELPVATGIVHPETLLAAEMVQNREAERKDDMH